MWSPDDHSLLLGLITPNFIISSSSRFAVTNSSGASLRGHTKTGCPLVTILCVMPCFTVLPFTVGRVSSGNWSSSSVCSLRTLYIRLSDNSLIEDKVACIAKPVLMSLKHLPCKSTSRLYCIKKSAPNMGCLMSATINVHEYSLFSPTTTVRSHVP